MSRPNEREVLAGAASSPQAIVPVPNRAASPGEDETTGLNRQIAKNAAHVSDILSLSVRTKRLAEVISALLR